MELSKKKLLEYEMTNFIKCVLDNAHRDDKLDSINIEITNFNGNLQMDYKLKDIKMDI